MLKTSASKHRRHFFTPSPRAILYKRSFMYGYKSRYIQDLCICDIIILILINLVVCGEINAFIFWLWSYARLPLDVAKTLASIASSVPRWTTAIQSSTVLWTQQQQSSRECKIVSLRRSCCTATAIVMSCSASTGIVTWLPTSHRINFKLATLAYKIQSTSQPTYLLQLIPRQFTALLCHYAPQVPRTRTAYGNRAFSAAV